jgi:hypothetical protein
MPHQGAEIIAIEEEPTSRSSSSRATALVTTAIFVALICVPGVYHMMYGIDRADLRRWGSWFAAAPTTETMRKIEASFDQRFLPAQVARTLVLGVPVKQLRPLSPEVVAGIDGFLFNSTDIDVVRSAGFCDKRLDRGRQAAAAIIDLNQQLRARGIHFLVVPVPAKASIYPEKLNPKYDVALGPDLNIDHARWMQNLRDRGVDVLDLTELFWSQRYGSDGLVCYPTDSHWTHHGMRLAAAQIAAALRPHLTGAPPAPPFKTRLVPYRGVGDLERMEWARPESAGPSIREDHLQLFDDAGIVQPGDEAPVLVIGDSSAALFVEDGSGLSQAIMAELGIAVQSAAIVGASGDMMRSVLRTHPELLTRKRIVVMAFSVRLLVCCDWSPIAIGP